MMQESKLQVCVLGAGRWAELAHIPGWLRDPRCEIAILCDTDEEKARSIAQKFGIPKWTTDWQAAIAMNNVDVVDVCTSNEFHLSLSIAALEAGKHVLCEKPVAPNFRDTLRAADLADYKGLKTKLGFTFRYSPGVQYAKFLIDEGFVGRPFICNAYEQNYQWLNPLNPLRQTKPEAENAEEVQVSSLEGYGAPVIDISRWWVGADYERVVGILKNFIPERMVRDTGRMMRMNIDDGDIYMAEYTNGAIGSVQSSYVTIGNYPGIEVRLYGEKGAIICRLVEEFGVAETIKLATPDDVEFKQAEIPARFYPVGGHPRESWRSMFYANLIHDFNDEIMGISKKNQGNFRDGAWVQEVINAVELSYRESRWVNMPLER
jgi:predicted dehydrogenase